MPDSNEENIFKILVSLDSKNAAGNDLILPKSAEILFKPLTDVTNATITKGIFSCNTKLASVKPIYNIHTRVPSGDGIPSEESDILL